MGRVHLGYLNVDGGMILKYILEEQAVQVRSSLKRMRRDFNDWIL
jgi:hypothetical protein